MMLTNNIITLWCYGVNGISEARCYRSFCKFPEFFGFNAKWLHYPVNAHRGTLL